MFSNSNRHPIISVVMSIYNGKKYLSEAVESILCQSFSDFEFLIMDDSSNDGSGKILRDFSRINNRIQLFVQNNNGLTNSLNKLIKKARGTYIAKMDADDISHPDRLVEQSMFLDCHPECGVVGTGTINIDANGGIISGYQLPDDHEFLLSWLEKGVNVYKHGSIMMRKSALNELVVPYRFYYGQDFDLYLRISEISRLGTVQKILFKYRFVGTSIQGFVSPIREPQKKLMLDLYFKRMRGEDEYCWQEEEKYLLSRLTSDNVNTRKIHTAYAIATSFFQQGRLKKAREYFWEAIKDPRFKKNVWKYILLTYMPSTIAIRFQRAMSIRGDKFKEYRISFDELIRIDKQFHFD